MDDTQEALDVILEDDAMRAVTEIAKFYGEQTTEEEAVQRSIGTQLYLLKKIVNERAKVIIQSENGERIELDLIS